MLENEKALREAREIIQDAFIFAGREGRHEPGCAAQEFARHNRICPPSHPVWQHAPACDCWVGRAAEFLKSNIN